MSESASARPGWLAPTTAPRVILSHPTGNENVRQTALALAETHSLAEFHTCLNVPPWLGRLPIASARRAAARALPPEVRRLTRSHSAREAGRLLGQHACAGRWTRAEHQPFSIDRIYRSLDEKVSRRLAQVPADAVYCYEDGAAATFRAASELGLARIYDLPIGYWQEGRRISQEEAEREPEWASTMGALRDSPSKLARKDQELALAEVVVVASRFTSNTIQGQVAPTTFAGVVPYGCPPALSEVPMRTPGPLRALYVGQLSQRKGLTYLLAACEALGPHVQLTLAGSRPSVTCRPLEQALSRHTYVGHLDRQTLLARMRSSDILVFPSLFEGFGLVILEALSQGLPVISTANTGAPDVLHEGEDGWIVPIRSASAIQERLQQCLDNPGLLADMKARALSTARARPWSAYRHALNEAIHVGLACRTE